jgi:hypothetical protein
MNPDLIELVAKEHVRDLLAGAERHRLACEARRAGPVGPRHRATRAGAAHDRGPLGAWRPHLRHRRPRHGPPQLDG